MKRLIYIALAVLICLPAFAKGGKNQKQNFVVGFYNVENLFDTVDDPDKNDDDFLPDGSYQWDDEKYQKKLHNIASVIKSMGDANGRYHTLLGLSEIENGKVLEDLVAQPEISDAQFEIVHYDSPDPRGIDVALLYSPAEFTLLDSEVIPFDFDSKTISFEMDEAAKAKFKTRDILMVHGTIDGEEVAVFVAHLPSRIGGKGADLRNRGAEIIYDHATQLTQQHPGIKIIVMGDMNDNPTDACMTKYLHAKKKPNKVKSGDFFLPFIKMHNKGLGTLVFQGTTNMFDNILVNQPLVDPEPGTLHIVQQGKKKYFGVIFSMPWMLDQTTGNPLRTFANGMFQNGYSDHLPTYILLSK